ncbi:hypothetical protein [Halovivax sp.]|uniref:hypothetical protein n=1 Tax=Halovivax sp. TaxID=1935978 RepID=UPI0025BD02E9|nr:hypothetical protein [Halovivax sp.]
MDSGSRSAEVVGATGGRPLAIQREAFQFYGELPPAGQAGVTLAGALILGAVVLGILPGYSERSVRTARRSPVISLFVGVPGALVLVSLLYIASLIAGDSLGVFFAIPLVSVGMTLLPAWAALGMVAAGCALGRRVGRDSLFVGLLVGSAIVGLSGFAPEALVAITALFATLGSGAGIRVLIGSGTTTNPNERSVPPANKI